MNADQVAALRELLAPTGWLDRTRYFGRALRDRARTPEGLLIVGTPEEEPWHMTAHLADESRLAGLPGLAPTLLRWAPPPDAPPHLSVSVERIESAGRDETLLVVSAQAAPAGLLQRLADARKTGTTIFALDTDDPELDGIAHEALAIRPGTAPVSFDAAQHLVSAAAGESYSPRHGRPAGGGAADGRAAGGEPADGGPEAGAGARRSIPGQRVSLRGRLAQLLDAVSGTPVD
jgi:hypothetical protein